MMMMMIMLMIMAIENDHKEASAIRFILLPILNVTLL